MTQAKFSELPPPDTDYQALYLPVSPLSPCGDNPDDDPQFLLLQASLRPKSDTEYGDYYEAAEPVNWADCASLASRLLANSKDIRLIIILMRCRIKATGLSALAGGIQVLLELLKRWPEQLHPQLYDDGEFIPQIRANAFAELEDPQGLLADIRHCPLPKTAGIQMTIGEYEKARTLPASRGTVSADTAARLSEHWQTTDCPEIIALRQAGEMLELLQQQLQINLAPLAPDINRLAGLLSLFNSGQHAAHPAISSTEQFSCIPEPEETNAVTRQPFIPAPETASRLVIRHRDEALEYLQQLRHWFSEAEPGSPAVQLLALTEAGIGKSFPELLDMYPPEIISLLKHH